MSVELVGRETEVAAVSDLLASERLVEIVGPGGVGKTAVAIATGRRLQPSDGVAAGGVWLARLETAVTADDVIDTLIAALNVPAARRRCSSGSKAATALVILDNCEHVIDAAAALAVRLLDAAPGLRILCTSQVPLDVDGEVRVRARTASLSPTPSSCSARRASAQRSAPAVGRRRRRRGGGPVPLARRSAAGDRARRGTDQDVVDRGDHPAPRRSLQRAERPDQPPTGTPPGAQVDDPMELRPAVPRRPAGTVGPGHVRRWRTAARGRVRPRSARRAGRRGDRRGRPARQPFARHRRRRRCVDDRSATGCSTASGRSPSKR